MPPLQWPTLAPFFADNWPFLLLGLLLAAITLLVVAVKSYGGPPPPVA